MAPDVLVVPEEQVMYVDRETVGVAATVIFFIALIAGLILWIQAGERGVDQKIQACMNRGGTPVVVGHQVTSEYKGCVMP